MLLSGTPFCTLHCLKAHYGLGGPAGKEDAVGTGWEVMLALRCCPGCISTLPLPAPSHLDRRTSVGDHPGPTGFVEDRTCGKCV